MSVEIAAIRLVMALRGAGICDTAILSAVERTPRKIFLPEQLAEQAWEDTWHNIDGVPFSRPFVVASLLSALDVSKRHRVLQIPTGTGYQASLLSTLCRWVYTVDPSRHLRKSAEARMRELDLDNVVSHTGEPENGWPAQAPFDRILLSKAAREAPKELLKQLQPGGVLVAPLGPDPHLPSVTRIVRDGAEFREEIGLELPPAVTGIN